MAIAQVKTPYELLVRWTDAGTLRGAHVVFRESITDSGVEISSKIGDALPVGVGGQQGFPLADIMTTLNTTMLTDAATKDAVMATLTTDKTTALAARDASAAQVIALTAQVATLTTDKAAALTERDTAVAHVATLTTQVATLTTQVAALQPPAPVNGVPQVVTMVQAQLALLHAGLLDQVNTAIAAIPGDAGRAAQIEWANSNTVERTNHLIVGMQAALPLTDAQVDALFVAAALL